MDDFEVLDMVDRLEPEIPVDLLIGVTGPVDESELRRRVVAALDPGGRSQQTPPEGLRAELTAPKWMGMGRILVASPGERKNQEVSEGGLLTMLAYRPAATQEGSVLEAFSVAERSLLQLAAEHRARVTLIVSSDMEALTATTVQAMLRAVLEEETDLVLPLYATGRYDGLLNTAILAPMSRALFARRVAFPLPYEFACSARYVMAATASPKAGTVQDIFWPLTHAVREPLGKFARIGQLYVAAQHASPFEGMDLTAVLGQVVGAFFAEVEQSAPVWQRLRGAQSVPVWGKPQSLPQEKETIEVRSMIESFELAQRNLGELWALVLPPVTLLELKRMSRMGAENFQMPDELWARIVYDFALAYRLRTLGRAHLMGALAPLYLAWLASYMQQIALLTPAQVFERQEQLARVFEANKPYLVSRWRWPDRFNP